MKFLNLVWRNALRNKRRTLLTVFSLAASLFLLTTLRTVLYELQLVSQAAEVEMRLVTRHAVSFTNPLPLAYMERIRAVPGVREVMPGHWFMGVYVDEKNFFAQFTADAEKLPVIYPEFGTPEHELEAFRKQRNAALAGVRLFDRFGWKVGDRITLKGANYPVDPELVIVGRYTSKNPPDEAALMFRWDYLDELLGRTGEVQWYSIMAESRSDIPRIIERVDEMFRNSSAPTKTETEKEFQLNFSGMMGNVRFLVASISAVVIFTLLLVTGATMGMNIRERTAEIGIFQSLGFTFDRILGLFLGEAALLALSGWLLGCVGAWGIYSHVDLQEATGGWFAVLRVQPDSIALGFALSLVVALAASGIPAYRAARRSAADSLRYVG